MESSRIETGNTREKMIETCYNLTYRVSLRRSIRVFPFEEK